MNGEESGWTCEDGGRKNPDGGHRHSENQRKRIRTKWLMMLISTDCAIAYTARSFFIPIYLLRIFTFTSHALVFIYYNYLFSQPSSKFPLTRLWCQLIRRGYVQLKNLPLSAQHFHHREIDSILAVCGLLTLRYGAVVSLATATILIVLVHESKLPIWLENVLKISHMHMPAHAHSPFCSKYYRKTKHCLLSKLQSWNKKKFRLSIKKVPLCYL